jgi:hypothetical protein
MFLSLRFTVHVKNMHLYTSFAASDFAVLADELKSLKLSLPRSLKGVKNSI